MQPAPQVRRKNLHDKTLKFKVKWWGIYMYINIYKHTCRRNLLNRSEQRSHGKMQKQSNKRHLKKKAIVSLGRHQDFSRNNFLDSACIAILSNLRRKFVKLQFQYQYQWNNLNSLLVDPQYFKIVWTVWTTNTSSYLLDSDNIMAIISYGWLLACSHIACWAIWHLLDIVAYAMHRPMWPLLFLHLLE